MSSENPLESLPLPKGKHSMWIYGAAIGLVVVAFIWYSRSSNAASNNADTTTSDGSLPEVSGSALGSSGSGDASGSGSAGTDTGTDTSTDSGDGTGTTIINYTDDSQLAKGTVNTVNPAETGGVISDARNNSLWERNAVAYLTSHGVGGQNAAHAINKYLSGAHLSYHEHLLINRAIRNVGLNPVNVKKESTFAHKPKPKPQSKTRQNHNTKIATHKASSTQKASQHSTVKTSTVHNTKAAATKKKTIQVKKPVVTKKKVKK